ncbi:MAG: ATPase/protein kinase [Cyclobacteriaceae bacterium]|nr:MAG: ATPase/protein kinase [Cyclobacteriaceae bacterium]
MKPPLSAKHYLDGIRKGDRVILARAISLAESTRITHRKLLMKLLQSLYKHLPGNTIRIGITGLPGAGKSTFIEAFGQYLTAQGKRVAVLTVDPTSPLNKGSILGDKTRMNELARNPLAFVRPSASGHAAGGVARHLRESVWLCEAAGYEVILLETVGVGQSETAVKNMTDFFMLLTLAGAGDELQGIKRGIMEMADAVVITKADGDNVQPARRAQAVVQQALHLLQQSESGWMPRALTCSALEGRGLEAIWNMVQDYFEQTRKSGYYLQNRLEQQKAWLRDLVHNDLQQWMQRTLHVERMLKKAEQQVAAGQALPQQAANAVMKELRKKLKTGKK